MRPSSGSYRPVGGGAQLRSVSRSSVTHTTHTFKVRIILKSIKSENMSKVKDYHPNASYLLHFRRGHKIKNEGMTMATTFPPESDYLTFRHTASFTLTGALKSQEQVFEQKALHVTVKSDNGVSGGRMRSIGEVSVDLSKYLRVGEAFGKELYFPVKLRDVLCKLYMRVEAQPCDPDLDDADATTLGSDFAEEESGTEPEYSSATSFSETDTQASMVRRVKATQKELLREREQRLQLEADVEERRRDGRPTAATAAGPQPSTSANLRNENTRLRMMLESEKSKFETEQQRLRKLQEDREALTRDYEMTQKLLAQEKMRAQRSQRGAGSQASTCGCILS